MENRAQVLKPGDFSLGQVHEWLGAFGRKGGTPDLLQRAIEDPWLMERMVNFWRSGGFEPLPKKLPILNKKWSRACDIMGKNFFAVGDAVRYFGVGPNSQQLAVLSEIPFSEAVLEELRDTHVLVAVFPLSILQIRSWVERGLFYGHEGAWYNEKFFARERGEVSWQLVRKTPVDNSTSKNWQEQQALIAKDDEVPSARVMVYTIIGYFLATGERLFEHIFVRTSSVDSDGLRVIVGIVGDLNSSLSISNLIDKSNYGLVGVSSARKSQALRS